jgi:hypothetical protein
MAKIIISIREYNGEYKQADQNPAHHKVNCSHIILISFWNENHKNRAIPHCFVKTHTRIIPMLHRIPSWPNRSISAFPLSKLCRSCNCHRPNFACDIWLQKLDLFPISRVHAIGIAHPRVMSLLTPSCRSPLSSAGSSGQWSSG